MKPFMILFAVFCLICSVESAAQNSAPYTIGPKKKWAVPGQTTCISIQTADSNANDTIRLSWNTAVQTATFTNNNGFVKHASGEFCWNPTQADASLIPHPFYITLDDGHVQVVDTFYISVDGIPERDSFHITKGACGERIFYATFNDWTDNVSYQIHDGLKYLFTTPVPEITVGKFVPGRYVLTTMIMSNTPVYKTYRDTFYVTEGHDVTSKFETLSEPNEYRITLTEHSGNPDVHYSWTLENSVGISILPDTLMQLTVQVWEPSILCVYILSDQNCTDTLCFSLPADPTGLQELNSRPNIYPNPCIQEISIESHKPMLSITLFDIQGKQALHQEDTATVSRKLKVAELPKGTYLLAIRFMDGSAVHHTVVVR